MQDYTIVSDADKKGRSFTTKCTCLVVADALWASGSSDTVRPIWAQFAGTDAELRPFATNLKLGRKAEPARSGRRSSASDRLEFLRSANYQLAWQREPEGTILTVYHPEIFRLDPGMIDPEGASFVLLVPRWWYAEQTLPADDARASLFAAMLDRRTRCPLVADVAFYRQLLAAALVHGLAWTPADRVSYARGFAAEGLDEAGIDPLGAIAFSAKHDVLEAFLAEQCSIYFGDNTHE